MGASLEGIIDRRKKSTKPAGQWENRKTIR